MLSAFIPAVLSYSAMPFAEQLIHHRYVHSGPLVLGTALLKFPTPATDRDRTVSRRSEPSSRTTLMGEQPNPWNRLQLQDVMSRHRGAKPPRRCELLGRSACYPQGSFLSVERRQFHSHSAGSLTPTFVTARPVRLAVRLPYAFALFARFPSVRKQPLNASVTFFGGDRPSQTAHLTVSPSRIHGCRLEPSYYKSGIPKVTPPKLAPWLLSLPPILYM